MTSLRLHARELLILSATIDGVTASAKPQRSLSPLAQTVNYDKVGEATAAVAKAVRRDLELFFDGNTCDTLILSRADGGVICSGSDFTSGLAGHSSGDNSVPASRLPTQGSVPKCTADIVVTVEFAAGPAVNRSSFTNISRASMLVDPLQCTSGVQQEHAASPLLESNNRTCFPTAENPSGTSGRICFNIKTKKERAAQRVALAPQTKTSKGPSSQSTKAKNTNEAGGHRGGATVGCAAQVGRGKLGTGACACSADDAFLVR